MKSKPQFTGNLGGSSSFSAASLYSAAYFASPCGSLIDISKSGGQSITFDSLTCLCVVFVSSANGPTLWPFIQTKKSNIYASFLFGPSSHVKLLLLGPITPASDCSLFHLLPPPNPTTILVLLATVIAAPQAYLCALLPPYTAFSLQQPECFQM